MFFFQSFFLFSAVILCKAFERRLVFGKFHRMKNGKKKKKKIFHFTWVRASDEKKNVAWTSLIISSHLIFTFHTRLHFSDVMSHSWWWQEDKIMKVSKLLSGLEAKLRCLWKFDETFNHWMMIHCWLIIKKVTKITVNPGLAKWNKKKKFSNPGKIINEIFLQRNNFLFPHTQKCQNKSVSRFWKLE